MRLKEWCKKLKSIDRASQFAAVTSETEHLVTGEIHAIKARDYYDVQSCDMLFAYLPKEINQRRPSWGTAKELGWASEMRKPVVIVTDDESLSEHPLFRGDACWIVPDLDTGVQVIGAVLGAYTEHN